MSLFPPNIQEQYGDWSVLKYLGRDHKSNQLILCRCKCGIEREHHVSNIKKKKSPFCRDCSTHSRRSESDLTGKVFGEWRVIKYSCTKNRRRAYYLCKCSCGREEEVLAESLRSNRSKSCPNCRVKTHGMSNTTTYKIWRGMFTRCYNKNIKAYKYYGARGISVCERWKKFENFLSDMGKRPRSLSIDRIDNDGNYEPGNCRWATASQQAQNRRGVL